MKALLIYNLPLSASEQSLRAFFQKFGQVKEANVISRSSRSTTAIVTMTPTSAGERAILALKTIGGRKVTIKGAKDKRTPKGGSVWALGGGLVNPR
jgi:RNA recognition motif-containing protein